MPVSQNEFTKMPRTIASRCRQSAGRLPAGATPCIGDTAGHFFALASPCTYFRIWRSGAQVSIADKGPNWAAVDTSLAHLEPFSSGSSLDRYCGCSNAGITYLHVVLAVRDRSVVFLCHLSDWSHPHFCLWIATSLLLPPPPH
jgi:hypothetical protein